MKLKYITIYHEGPQPSSEEISAVEAAFNVQIHEVAHSTPALNVYSKSIPKHTAMAVAAALDLLVIEFAV